MKIEIQINKKVVIDLDVDDVIEQINEFAPKEKLNCSARIINGIELKDLSSFEPDEKEMIIKYLEDKLAMFKGKPDSKFMQVEVIKDFINKVYKPTGYKTKTKFEMLVEVKKLEQELENS